MKPTHCEEYGHYCPNCDNSFQPDAALAKQLADVEKRYLKAAEELAAAKQLYRWRPIEEIHEDFGPCVVMRIGDPGRLEVASCMDCDFSIDDWTHFALVPRLTHEDAAMLAARAPESCPHCTDGVQVTADSENRIHTRPCPHCAACAPEGTTATDSAGKREG